MTRSRSGPIGQKLRELSLALFRRIFGEDYWGYNRNRFLPIVQEALGSADGVIIDAACGFRNIYLEQLTFGDTIGIDVDESVTGENRHHSKFLIQDMHDEIELSNVGGIISLNTWEHLRDPQIVLRNFHNILRYGANLVIIAPQKYYYISLITLILPASLQDLAWRLAKNRSHMPYPSFYRLCSQKALATAAETSGFELITYRSIDLATTWFMKVPPLFLLACGWMALVNRIEWLSPIRGSFVAVLRKR